jgi:hypothetical protein
MSEQSYPVSRWLIGLFYGLAFAFIVTRTGWPSRPRRRVIRALQTRRQSHVVIASLTAVLAVPYLLYVAWTQVNDGELAMTIAHIEKLDDSGLAAFLTEGKFRSNTYALAAVALNPAASTATLARIAAMDIPALHRKFGGRRELMGKTARASQ